MFTGARLLPVTLVGGGGGGGGGLDTQTVTTGASGTALDQDRRRGYESSGLGSINDGTSSVYSGAAITELLWDEMSGIPEYRLKITGASNSGWNTLTIGSLVLNRTAAGYFSGTWTWATSDSAAAQAFGSGGSSITCKFD